MLEGKGFRELCLGSRAACYLLARDEEKEDMVQWPHGQGPVFSLKPERAGKERHKGERAVVS